MMNFIFRVFLLLIGLVFAASLAVAALLLAAVWGVRYGWARLTGKSVTPWTVMFGNRFDPRTGFERFRTAGATRRAEPTAADVVAARARGDSSASHMNLGRGAAADDVTDVRARPVVGHE